MVLPVSTDFFGRVSISWLPRRRIAYPLSHLTTSHPRFKPAQSQPRAELQELPLKGAVVIDVSHSIFGLIRQKELRAIAARQFTLAKAAIIPPAPTSLSVWSIYYPYSQSASQSTNCFTCTCCGGALGGVIADQTSGGKN